MINRIALLLLVLAAPAGLFREGAPIDAVNNLGDARLVYVENGMWKAADFLKFSQDGQAAFAAGFIDGVLVAPYLGAPDRGGLLVSFQQCIVGMNDVQAGAIIEKHVQGHPETWDRPLNTEAWNAMQEACRTRR